MAKKSKKMQEALKKVEAAKLYSVEEAVALAKETNFAKFDATNSLVGISLLYVVSCGFMHPKLCF